MLTTGTALVISITITVTVIVVITVMATMTAVITAGPRHRAVTRYFARRKGCIMPIVLFGFWLILNGRFTVEVAVIGAVVSVLVSLLNYGFLGISFTAEKKAWLKIGSIIGYFATLIAEIIKANWQMIKLVLSPAITIKPQLIHFNSPLRTEIAQVTLANSITLTPGTITVNLEHGRFTVHAIDVSTGNGIEDSVFVRQLKKIEGGH